MCNGANYLSCSTDLTRFRDKLIYLSYMPVSGFKNLSQLKLPTKTS